MAKDKKAFVAYCDWMEAFEELDDDEAGRLAKHLFRYVNDLNPDPPDKITKASFTLIKQALKRDLIKYEEKKKQWSDAGKASARKRKERQRTSTTVESRSTVSTVNVSDNVSVNDSVTVKNNTKVLDKSSKVIKQNPKTTKKEFPRGRPDINELMEYLKSAVGMLDQSVKVNRQYCKLLIDKLKKEHPDSDPVDNIKALIDVAMKDKWFKQNITSFKFIYYNAQKIANTHDNKFNSSDIDNVLARMYGKDNDK